MKYSFDDQWFGMTKDGNKLDERIVERPNGLENTIWYAFAGKLVRVLNEKAQVGVRSYAHKDDPGFT